MNKLLPYSNCYISKYFKTNFNTSFKYNGLRRPYLKENEFNYQIQYIKEKYKNLNEYQIIKKILDLNNKYSMCNYNWFPSKGKKTNLLLIEEIKKNNLLYLGLLPLEWHKHLEKIPEYNSEIKISQSLRQQVWVKYAGKNYEIKCICCNINTINCFTFECGHIKPSSKGGLNNINNLKPICGLCNKSMNTIDLNKFQEFYLLKNKN